MSDDAAPMSIRLRLVIVQPNEVKLGEFYVMGAIPTKPKLKPGEIPAIGVPQIDMRMVPSRLEWVDEANGVVHPVMLEQVEESVIIAPPRARQ